MNFCFTLNLLLCFSTPMEPAVNEKLALQLIQEWKTWHNNQPHDFNKQQKLGDLAKKDEAVMKLLLKELETRDAPNQFYPGDVAKLLGFIKSQEAVPALFRFLQDKTRSDLNRFGAGRGLGLIGKPALPTIAEALKSSDVFVRRMAVDSLSAMGDLDLEPKKGLVRKGEPGAILLLLEALQDKNEEVRQNAVECFECAFTAEFAGPYLCKALHHKNPLVRAGAADALIQYKENMAEAEKTLLELLGHADVEVRLQALLGFRHEGRSYNKAAVAPLRSALKDKDARVRAGAALALSGQGPAAEPAVGDLLKLLNEDKEEIVRAEAASALGSIGPAAKEAVPVLIATLKENSVLLHWSAINALGDIGPDARAAIPALERILQEYQDLQSPDDAHHVARVLAKIRGKKVSERKK